MIIVWIAGCQPAGTPVPSEAPMEASPVTVQNTNTVEPSATQPPPPTATPLPIVTPTAAIEPTATPEYLIFRDDFNDAIRPEWTWENENKERWTISPDGWLQIIGEDPALPGDTWLENSIPGEEMPNLAMHRH